jgi:RND family efflux transporter MFP subunit
LDFVETLALTGSLVAREDVLVAPEIEGLRIVTVSADESQAVKKGDVLATLETATLKAQLAQNDATLARADAGIAQAKSAIISAEARQVEAQNALARARPLRQSGIVADATFDQRESAARTADAQVLSARDGLRLSQAERAQAEATRRDLEWRLSKTEIRSPVDGIVSRRNARMGQMVSAAGEPMFRLIAGGEVELEADVPEILLARLQVGQEARLSVAGVGDLRGRVRLLSPEVDKSTRLARVRILVLDMKAPRIGAFARAQVTVATGRGLALPASAVQFNPDETTVQVVVGDQVETRRVVTGLTAKGMVEIRSGLQQGDVVIARAGTFVRNGDTVRPVKSAQKMSEAN